MPELERSGPKLIYKQIVDWMRQQVASGSWPEHYRLPSEIDLAAQLSVSRGTVRKAIRGLISEGILVSIHGRGTFVESRTIEQPLAERLVAFSEALIEKKIPFITQVINQQIIPSQERIAHLLSVQPGSEIFYLERVRLVRQSPIIHLVNYVNIKSCPGIEKVDFEKYRLFETLEKKYRLELGWGQRTFQAQIADDHVAKILNISPCDPVMYMEQLLYLHDGTPIEFSNLWIKGNSFHLSAIVKRGEKSSSSENGMLFETTGE